MSTNDVRNDIFTAMNTGKPYKSYKKAILGKVRVTVWDNFVSSPTEVIVEGDPNRDVESCIIDVWSEQEKVFFERMNRKHFEAGNVINYTRVPAVEAKELPIEQWNDEQLTDVVNSKFLAFKATLNKTESTAVLFRMRALAEQEEKSEKIMQAIDARISELQMKEYVPVKQEE